jgi:hypothetical protein
VGIICTQLRGVAAGGLNPRQKSAVAGIENKSGGNENK